MSVGELPLQRRKPIEQFTPGRLWLPSGFRFQCGPGTGHTVVEPEHPSPTILENMVDCGVVRWIRRSAFVEIRELIESRDVPEMCVNRMSTREIWVSAS